MILSVLYLVNCIWSDWSIWELCTATCGGGMQTRTRSILEPARNGGERCEGEPLEMQTCNMQPCQSKQWESKLNFCESQDYVI